MQPSSFLDHGDRSPHPSRSLEVAQQYDCVREVGHVDRRLHVADKPMLCNGKEGIGALPVQILKQLMHVKDQRIFIGHRRLIAVDAIDDDSLGVRLVHAFAHAMREFTW